MSENETKQPITVVDPAQHCTVVGHVQHLQVEDDPSGPVMVCSMKVESSEAIEYFFLRLTNNQPVFDAQFHLLRVAIVHNEIRVRITYDPKEKLGPNASRIIAVRLQFDS